MITPVRNEAEYLPGTIASMIAQDLMPACWVIVNDGSTDATGDLIDDLAERHPFVRALHRTPTKRRERGAPVGEAFLAGLEAARGVDWDFVVKLDGDVTFDPHYFDSLLTKFDEDPSLGLASGHYQEFQNGAWEFIPIPRYHVTGASKTYRRACYEDIGGVEPIIGWDTLDELRSMHAGWRTQHFSDLPYRHHRVQGGADGLLNTRWASGVNAHNMGADPTFFFCRTVKHILATPMFLSPVAMLAGFWWQTLRGAPRAVSSDEMAFHRRFQRRRMLGWIGIERELFEVKSRVQSDTDHVDENAERAA